MGDSSIWSTVLIFGVPILAMYLLFIRPQQKKLRAQHETVNRLEPGARIMTTAGVYATLVHMGQRQAIIEISPGVEMTVARQAISRVVASAEEDFEYEDENAAEVPAGEALAVEGAVEGQSSDARPSDVQPSDAQAFDTPAHDAPAAPEASGTGATSADQGTEPGPGFARPNDDLPRPGTTDPKAN